MCGGQRSLAFELLTLQDGITKVWQGGKAVKLGTGQFNKIFASVIYKCSYCFQTLKTIATLVNKLHL